MTALNISYALLWGSYTLLKSIFLGSWFAARWLAWLLSPLWFTVAAAGAACGLLSDR